MSQKRIINKFILILPSQKTHLTVNRKQKGKMDILVVNWIER